MKYKRLYIAYGSNINLEQMAFRCPNSKVVGTRMNPDYELEFRGVATIVPKKGAAVPVLLWEIDQRDELRLDRYEGFPRMYRKELFEVEVDGKIREGINTHIRYNLQIFLDVIFKKGGTLNKDFVYDCSAMAICAFSSCKMLLSVPCERSSIIVYTPFPAEVSCKRIFAVPPIISQTLKIQSIRFS